MSERMEGHKVNSEEHGKKVSAKVLEYLQSAKCGDVVLVSIDGTRMWAHRMVLSACSEYFEEIFMQKENTIEKLELDVDGKILRVLLQYWYSGEICVSEENAEDLMVAATQYLMQLVVNACAPYLVDLGISNCLEKIRFAERCNLSDLLEEAKVLACKHFTEVPKTRGFLQLTFENLRSIITSDDLQVPCEEYVLNCVLWWLQHDWPTRQDHFEPLMKCIRLSLLPSTLLTHPNQIGGSDCECHELRNLMEQHLRTEGTTSKLSLPEAPRKGSSAILLVEDSWDNGYWRSGLRSFCPQSKNWKKWSNMPEDRCDISAALLGGNLIIAGGFIPSTVNLKPVNTAYMQNLETKVWTPLRNMQLKRATFSLVALNGFVYAIGGLDNKNVRLNTVERLDPSDLKNTWKYVAPMSCSRSSLAAVVLEGRLYVAGGLNTPVIATNSVECYDPKTNMWTERAPMIYNRAGLAAVAINGYLYVLGGNKDNGLETVERYDPQANKWTELCSIDGGFSLAAAIIGNRIFVIGGVYHGHPVLQEYNIETNEWTKTICTDERKDAILWTIIVPNFYSLNSS